MPPTPSPRPSPPPGAAWTTCRRATRLACGCTAWPAACWPTAAGLDGVREAFARLRPDDREILALAGWEGLGSDEIATVLGCSRGAARLRLHRARKRLARQLQAAGLDVARIGFRAMALTKGAM